MKKTFFALFTALILGMMFTFAVTAEDYTFKDKNGVTRTVPDGEYSFATRVVEFIPGYPWTSAEDANDQNLVLGLPDYISKNHLGTLPLGYGGIIVVEFNINITDGEGEDLYVFETGPDVEDTLVEVSRDLVTWYEIGVSGGGTIALDMKGKIPEGMSFRYVRITDLKEYDKNGKWSGADIDAIAGLNVRPVSSEWSESEIDKAFDYDLVPDILKHAVLSEPITRLEFVAVCVKVYENLAATKALPSLTNPFTDCSDTEMLKGYNVGITTGIAADKFDPNGLLNREQAATMLTRVFKRVTIPGWTLAEDKVTPFGLEYTMPKLFADDALISEWAKDSVYFMAANNIIKGVNDNKFAPKNSTAAEEAIGYANTTREQALAIAVRMVENLK